MSDQPTTETASLRVQYLNHEIFAEANICETIEILGRQWCYVKLM